VSAADLAIMRRVDALYLDHPLASSTMLLGILCGAGVPIPDGPCSRHHDAANGDRLA
jgi:hypothetical protein